MTYLKDAVPAITCSRSAISPLKLWWKIAFSEPDVFEKQAAQLIANVCFRDRDGQQSQSMKPVIWQNGNITLLQLPFDESTERMFANLFPKKQIRYIQRLNATYIIRRDKNAGVTT